MALELKNISKKVGGETHIYPTSLSLDRGSFNILLGTTLAGKTSLMQLMAGLEKPSGGQLYFDGKDVTGLTVQKRNVSMVYQQFINYPSMSVFENIASPLKVAGVDKAQIKQRAGEIAELMKISAMLDRKPSQLSGGQQQRCAMARALVKDSDLILLDEPLANLDFKLREELRDELPKLFAQRDCVVVYATTEPTEALLFGGMTAAMHEGKVVQFGPTADIYRMPRDLVSAKVFSEPPINFIEVVKSNQKVSLSDSIYWQAPEALKHLSDGRYTFAIRPHFVTPQQNHTDSIGVKGIVDVAELSGSESTIHFTTHGQKWISLSHGIHPFDVGEEANLYMDVNEGLYFDQSGRAVGMDVTH